MLSMTVKVSPIIWYLDEALAVVYNAKSLAYSFDRKVKQDELEQNPYRHVSIRITCTVPKSWIEVGADHD